MTSFAMELVSQNLRRLLPQAAERRGRVVVLTGAGLSAESGVSTFRGDDGRWQVGSRSYHPVELATFMAFQRMPIHVWGWYLHRRARYHAATPNPAHRAVAALEQRLGDRCLLVTENVDGLHLRAGNSPERTFQIHGNVDHARCAAECCPDIHRLPDDFASGWKWGQRPGDAEVAVLTCTRCGGWLRPHVLWFDEHPDEERFHADSALQASTDAAVLVVAGATTAPLLPTKICATAAAHGVLMVVMDDQGNSLNEMAASSPNGISLRGPSSGLLPQVCETLAAQFGQAR
jgi:NAD-dependent deacetylase